MKSIYSHRKIAAAIGGLFIAATLILGGQSAQFPDSDAAEGYLTHITTDKPIYRTGEKLYVRGVVLRANGHSPTAAALPAFFEIKGPKGETVSTGASSIIDSTIGFSWDIPAGQAGGEYTVRILNPVGAPAERKFDIRAYRAPRLKSQIAFVRDGYGPGDNVAANLHVERAEGGIPSGARVTVTARVDGKETWTGTTTVDSSGNANTRFKLPAEIERGEGVLAMTIQDGGTVETATKTIPILLQTLDLALYPEGGDLIAGLPNRVYFEGRTPAQKPADTSGMILNAAGEEVAEFRSEHEGRGRFTFVPEAGETYSLHVIEPAGIRTIFPLPSVKENGVVLFSTSDVTPRKKDVTLRISATREGVYDVALTQRGKEFGFKSVSLKANQASDVRFTLPRSLDGVLVATVYDKKKTPMAERLLFRQPERQIDVKVTADQSDYVPGDKVTLKVETTEDSNPVGAMVGLTVTDSSVLEMIEKREQAPRLPVMVLFENEVRNLSDAHVYLDESNPRAPLATDLLLGTQGWRRFASVDPAKFFLTYNDAARRVLGFRQLMGTVAGIGTLSGAIYDSTSALIPGVTVKVTNRLTGVTTTVLTNEAGTYSFATLPAGSYTLTASLPGFQSTVVSNVTLGNAVRQRLNMVMKLGAVQTTVDVSVDAGPILTASSSSIGAVLSEKKVRDLPLVGNDVLDLVRVLPGVPGTTFSGNSANPVYTVRDGAIVVDPRFMNGVFGTTITNPDMVGEIRLILAPVDSELGRGNAQIQIATAGGRPGAAVRNTPAQVPVMIREFAHPLQSNWNEGSRADFAETVYWSAGVRTDSSTGVATVSFNLSDTVTSFRVLADAFDHNGTLGSGISHVESVKPFSIEPKLPLQITSGDVIQLPISIINGMSRELRGAEVTARTADGLKFTMTGNNSSTLGPKERTRRLMQIDVTQNFSGMASLSLDAKAGAYRDSVSRKLDIQPQGFPYELGKGGVLDKNSSVSFDFTLPAEVVHGSISSSVTVYPTPLASMTDALQSLLQQPYGCFEQTSSTSYPMVMAQQYFITHRGVEPAIIEKARKLVDVSYKRLTGFESRSRGYEWFGGDPGHEALSAYGLMQFTDMAQVHDVDKDMLARTRGWLLSRRDGNGGFKRDTRSHGSGIGSAPTETVNAYTTWALIESGEKGLDKEIAAVRASANSTQDSYIVALGANILATTGDIANARPLMEKLARAQDATGFVKGAKTSMTQSGGNSLAIEATSLSVLAWIHDPEFAPNVEKGMRWIVESNKNGRFGSTQSTILALRSIVAYDNAHSRTRAPGRIVLMLDGKRVGAPLAFTANAQGALVLPELASELGAGKHTIALRMEDGSSMPFSISLKFHSTLPDSAEQTQIGIQVALKDGQIQEGGITEAMVSIANKSDQAIPTPVAIVGIPGGLEVRHDQLKEMVKSGRIDAYEVIGREVVLYWRYVKANDSFDIPLSLVAAVPGSYTGPASRAYLYYTDEYKNWAPGLKVNITPK